MARKSLIIIVALTVLPIMAANLFACSQPSSPAVRLPASTPPPSPTPPNAPSNVTAGEVEQTSVKLRWTDHSDNEDSFRIYRDGRLIGTVGKNVVIYNDTGLKPATTYEYVVKACNQAGESGDSYCTVRTLNPPITVKLDRIGVFDNGEIAFRDFDGGEVYVYVVVSDGKTTAEERVPLQEDKYLFLEDNDVVDVGKNIFSTGEVGDSLTIAFVGYERDGGAFEQLVYTALGAAVESQITGGTGSLLEAFELSLGGLMADLFGAEDDWLGSYENTWDSDSNWGIGSYIDIACEEEDGTLGLRLWFTVESSVESSPPRITGTPVPVTVPEHILLMEDDFTLPPSNEAAFTSKYPRGPSQYPFSEYGIYGSGLFPLKEGDTVGIFLISDAKICIENSPDDCEDGLAMLVCRHMSADIIRSYAARIISSEIDNFGNSWEATITFNAVETGNYQLILMNESGKPVSCEYVIFLKK
jgi:hypothetical protein